MLEAIAYALIVLPGSAEPCDPLIDFEKRYGSNSIGYFVGALLKVLYPSWIWSFSRASAHAPFEAVFLAAPHVAYFTAFYEHS